MHSQNTSKAIVDSEKCIIKRLVNLSNKEEIVLNDTGWESRVYSFNNGKYYFKFPRSSKVQKVYKYEISALERLQKLNSSVVTQKIIWKHPKNQYFGYEGLSGKSLAKSINGLAVKQKIAIGYDVGHFLKQLHLIKLNGARKKTINNELEQIQLWYKSGAEIINGYFTPKQQQKLEQLVYIDWPKKLKELGSDYVFSHGDLDYYNIIYSNKGNVGIIDFGDVAYYDRSKDFIELNNDSIIYNNALKAYDLNSLLLSQKIAIRQQMIQIINLGYFAGKKDNVNLFNTVQKIKKFLT